MSEQQTEQKPKTFVLPDELAGTIDLARIIRELEAVDDFMYQASIRTPGSSVHAPRTSHLLEKIAQNNEYSLLDEKHRKQLVANLRKLEKAAPMIHISFASEPSAKFVQRVTAWLRENIHSYLLVEVGLQPAIAVGCVVRTDNKIFDMSLRHKFGEFRSILVEKMRDGMEAVKVEVPAVPEDEKDKKEEKAESDTPKAEKVTKVTEKEPKDKIQTPAMEVENE